MTSENKKKPLVFNETCVELLIECSSKHKTIINDKKTNGTTLALKLNVIFI